MRPTRIAMYENRQPLEITKLTAEKLKAILEEINESSHMDKIRTT